MFFPLISYFLPEHLDRTDKASFRCNKEINFTDTTAQRLSFPSIVIKDLAILQDNY